MSDEHPPCLILSFLCRPSTQLPALDIGIKIVHMILEECKQLMDFQVMNKKTPPEWCTKLEFCYMW